MFRVVFLEQEGIRGVPGNPVGPRRDPLEISTNPVSLNINGVSSEPKCHLRVFLLVVEFMFFNLNLSL